MSRSFGGTSLMRAPSTRISPALIFSRPATMRSAVDFPHPDGPTRIRNSPSPTSSERSSTAITPASPLFGGNTFDTCSNVTWATRSSLQALGRDAADEPPLRQQEEHEHRHHAHHV